MNRRSFIKRLATVPLASAFRAAAPLGKIKITGFDIHKVSVRWRDLMFVEVHTDAGITGLGEATLESRTDIAESVLRWLEPEYVGLDPAGPEAQALVVQWNQLALRYGLRKFMTTLLEWNPAVAQKWLQVGERAMSRSIASQAAGPDDGLWAYFGAAQEASPWHQALRQNADEAAKLVDSKVDPSSPPAMEVANRLARICADHSLGDPLVYARWAGAMQFRRSADENARTKSAWAYLADALQAHAPAAN